MLPPSFSFNSSSVAVCFAQHLSIFFSFGSAPDFVLQRLRQYVDETETENLFVILPFVFVFAQQLFSYQGLWLANPDSFWLNDLKVNQNHKPLMISR